jgi:hypothetical protein
MQKWQDFCEASEEEQLRVLMGLRSDRGRSRLERRLQPQERFNRIDRRVKALLKVLLRGTRASCSALAAG